MSPDRTVNILTCKTTELFCVTDAKPQVITFGFDTFQAYISPNTVPADHSKNCQIHLSLKYPGGFQYSVLDVTYQGYARLNAGVTGSFYSTYSFSQAAENTVCFNFLTRCRTLSRSMRDLTMSLGKHQEHHLRPRVGERLDLR